MTTEHETPLIRAVDDDEDQLISLEALLSGEGWDVAAYTSARDFFVNDRPSRPGCLILDPSNARTFPDSKCRRK